MKNRKKGSGDRYPTGGGNVKGSGDKYRPRAVKSSLVALTLGVALLWPKSVYALEVGDKMPEVKGKVIRTIPIYRGEMELQSENGMVTQSNVYRICNGERDAKPFGSYDFKTKTVYIDSNMDGFVDRKDRGVDIKSPKADMPECK